MEKKSNTAFLPLVVVPPNSLGNSLLDKKGLSASNMNSEVELWVEKEAGFRQAGIRAFGELAQAHSASTTSLEWCSAPGASEGGLVTLSPQGVCCLNVDATTHWAW